MDEPALRIRHLTYGHPGRPLFVDWAADVDAGVTWIVGDEGCGKTSLLQLIAGELPSGEAIFTRHGARLSPAGAQGWPEVAWCDPRTEAHHPLTALQFLERLQARHAGFDAAELQRHIAGFGLAPHLAKPLYQLSTGSRRKVFIAGSLAASAPITLLDQPAAALDDASCRHLQGVLDVCAAAPRGRVWLVADHQAPAAADGRFRVVDLTAGPAAEPPSLR